MIALPTRRMTLAAAAALCANALGGVAYARPVTREKPIVIAHRGASGERPEESRLAYELAIDEGADFIEPDLVPTKDGHLVCRHEPEIGGTTDVARHPEFADRKTTLVIDGEKITGWFTQDFTLAELKTLRCRERLPELRPGSASFDGQSPILTYQEMVGIAEAGSRRTGRTIGTYPEMKHPTFFASIGLPLEHRLLGPAEGQQPQLAHRAGVRSVLRGGRAEDLLAAVAGAAGAADRRRGRPGRPAAVTYAEMITPTA